MDGFKKRLNASIQLKLSLSLSLAILLVAVLAGGFSFLSALSEAHELQDDTLRQVAALVSRQAPVDSRQAGNERPSDSDPESRVIVEYLGHGGKVASADGSQVQLQVPIPPGLPEGLHTLTLNGKQFRVLVRSFASGARVAVAQETAVRDEIARDSSLRTLMPFLILVPILLLIVAKLVGTMFRPITLLSREIDQRAERDLRAVEEAHLPFEVRPFAIAINRLLARVARSMEVQRRFVADAAHELRSPLTAMSLQAERMTGAEMPDTVRERLTSLQRGIDRGRNLLEQLLALAKAQTTTEPPEPAPQVSVQRTFRRVLEDLQPLAEARHIDIGVEGEQDVELRVSELDLTAIVRNLVDNAIRYTPDAGKVDLSVALEPGGVALRVQDSGPGIPASERSRVFDPFYRVLGNEQPGSGLGLSIVQSICDRIGAKVRLTWTDEAQQSGLSVCVTFAREVISGAGAPHSPFATLPKLTDRNGDRAH
jgi:two-component system OmpR family sensor kinase